MKFKIVGENNSFIIKKKLLCFWVDVYYDYYKKETVKIVNEFWWTYEFVEQNVKYESKLFKTRSGAEKYKNSDTIILKEKKNNKTIIRLSIMIVFAALLVFAAISTEDNIKKENIKKENIKKEIV